MSSELPRFLIPSNGVEDDEEPSHAEDHSDHLGLAGSDQSLPEVPNGGIVTHGDHGGEEQRCADGAPAAGDEGLAVPLTRLTDEGRREKRDQPRENR
jgi:hypothetical protein